MFKIEIIMKNAIDLEKRVQNIAKVKRGYNQNVDGNYGFR